MNALEPITLSVEQAEEIQALLEDPREPGHPGVDMQAAEPGVLLLRRQQEYFEDPC